ncbi:MAG TPA: hypothetical protein VHJ37_05020 [Thermoleophilaceae bacterium]|jgi:hypothetical protein|nr:hypothetical protein [Thermoleophilaceae bacterium]
MPRLILTAVLTTIVVLSAAPGAGAKVITAMKVCGPDRCVQLERTAAQRYHDRGGLEGRSIDHAMGATPHYRLTTFFGDGQGGTAARFVLAYSPPLKATLPLDSGSLTAPYPWRRVPPSAARRLSRLTQGIEPFPAKRLAAGVHTGARDSLPPETFQPADATPHEDGGGLPKPLLAGAPVALLLGLGLVGWRRGR